MNEQDYKFLEDFLKKESGLIVTPEKTYLLESRLLPVAKGAGLSGLDDLIAALRQGNDVALRKKVVDAMTTNETSFFRDNTPFTRLTEDILPRLAKARKSTRTLRIWCAACSTGQEPYSIAMLIKEHEALFTGWKIEIIATDLAQHVLDSAKEGIYSQFEVQRGLPIQMLVKYFTKLDDRWQLKPEIRSMVSFRPINLLGNFSTFGPFDIVFCRNVLIYFDVPTKAGVLAGIKKTLRQDGVLFLGGAETVIGITTDFRPAPNLRSVYLRDDGVLPGEAETSERSTLTKNAAS